MRFECSSAIFYFDKLITVLTKNIHSLFIYEAVLFFHTNIIFKPN